MIADLGSIYGPRVRTTRPRIDFWHGIPEEASWDSMWELIQQRQRWVRAHYGVAAFEDKPLYDGYSDFDLTDGGRSLQVYAKMLSEKDAQKTGFILNKQAFEHDDNHFVRLRPFCPTCRGSRVLARLSLSSWLVTHPGRLPNEVSDLELGWDTEQVEAPIATRQADLYMSLDQLASMRPPNDLIEGILPSKGVGYITGRDRSLKTFLALDMCLHIAFMMPFWHIAGRDAQTGPRRRIGFNGEGKFIFAAGEGVSSFHPRIEAWVAGQHVKSYGDPDIMTDDDTASLRVGNCAVCDREADDYVGHVGHLEFEDPDDIANTKLRLRPGVGELESRNITVRRGTPNFFAGGEDYRYMLARARRERPDVIVVDTLALASGGADQQSNSEMGEVHQRAAALAEASGGVVIIIAHTDKGDNDARGASTIEDNADFVLHCDRKDNDHVEVTVAKRKDAEDNWSFHLGVTPIDLGFDQSSLILHDFDGELHASTDVDAELEFEQQLMAAAERIVIGKRCNEFTAYEFAAEIDKSRKTVGRHLDTLCDSGDLYRIGGGRGAGNAVRYYFPDAKMAFIEALGHEIEKPHNGS